MDVAVVGAGLAGCAAASVLTAQDHAVTVYEQGPPGKDKPCGDAFLPDAVEHLRAVGVDLEADPPPGARRFDQVGLWAGGRRLWRTSAGAGPGWVAPRAAVDQRLRDAVAARGCTIHHDHRVVAVNRTGDHRWTVEVAGRPPVEVDAVVLAVGAHGRLLRQVGIGLDAPIARSLSVYVEGSTTTSADFHFGATPFTGYAWEFPLSGGRGNVGVCSVTDGTAALRPALERFVSEHGLRPAGRPRGGTGPLWVGTQRRWHHEGGAVTCGDAAGLVDALTGEGIGAALRSGLSAGRALADHADGVPGALAGYSVSLAADTASRLAPSPARRVWEHLARMPGG